jgi:hypothetical protein
MQVAPATATTWQALGVLATFLGTILTLVVSWVKERSASARRIQILDEAKRYVEFWKAYSDITSGTFKAEDAAALSRDYLRNFKMIEEYIEYEVTQPIRKVVTDAPVWWVRREVFKERAKNAVRTWGVITPMVFLLLWAVERTNALSYAADLFRAPSGVLVVLSDPPGASVLLGGSPAGLTNIERRITPGLHDVVVQRRGKIVLQERVAVDKNRVVQINVP